MTHLIASDICQDSKMSISFHTRFGEKLIFDTATDTVTDLVNVKRVGNVPNFSCFLPADPI